MMKDFETWKDELERKIEIQKEKGRKVAIYLISERMNAETASALFKYFSKYYSVEKSQCNSCNGRKWDIIITQKE